MRRMLALVALAIVVWNGAAKAYDNDEEDQRWAIYLDARKSLLAGDVSELERQYQEYSSTQARTQSGQWKLNIFDASLHHVIREEPNRQTRTELEKEISTWESRFPKSCGAHLERSHIWIDHAWKARGDGWADAVSDKSWKQFKSDLAKGRRALLKWKKTCAADPQWYAYMLILGKSEGWPRAPYLALVDEALRTHPLYYQIYFAALEYFYPRWFGSIDDIDAFVTQATNRTRAQIGSEMYARLYWEAACCQFNGNLFSAAKASWPLMKAGFRDLTSRYPDAWNLNNFAKFSCMAGDRQTTLELMHRIRGHFIAAAWPSQTVQSGCSLWAVGGRQQPPEFDAVETHQAWTELAGN